MDSPQKPKTLGTDCVHAGFSFDECTGAVMPPINLATTFKQTSPGAPIGVLSLIDSHSQRGHCRLMSIVGVVIQPEIFLKKPSPSLKTGSTGLPFHPAAWP
mgnify:CR=1 FL=1